MPCRQRQERGNDIPFHSVGDYIWLGINKRKGNNMNAGILMMIFVIAIANIGGVYFYIKDHNIKGLTFDVIS